MVDELNGMTRIRLITWKPKYFFRALKKHGINHKKYRYFLTTLLFQCSYVMIKSYHCI